MGWWTPERNKLMYSLLKQGFTYDQIAEKMGTTRGAIAGKINRNGGYRSPIKNKPVRRKRRAALELTAEEVLTKMSQPPNDAVSFLDNVGCKYPYDGGLACGKEVTQGVYCEEHEARCNSPRY